VDRDVETTVYGVAEDALALADAPRALTVRMAPDHRELAVIVQARAVPVEAERLAPLNARLEPISGRLSASQNELRAAIPVEGASMSERNGPAVASARPPRASAQGA
jgi:hypothetical protein